MLNDNLLFNYRSIRSFTSYECEIDENTLEKEVSFHVDLGPTTERKGDAFPVYQVPEDRMIWLSDWSFNASAPVSRDLIIGGSLGRITVDSEYIFVLNCGVSAGELQIYSPARPVRYLPGEWLAVCFHQIGIPFDLKARATFRFTEVPSEKSHFRTRVNNWWAKNKSDLFDERKL